VPVPVPQGSLSPLYPTFDLAALPPLTKVR
jgi:hypothetical protein